MDAYDDYQKQVKELQAQARADLEASFARAEARAKADPMQRERRLFSLELGFARLNKCLSQAELAERTGISQPDISRIENGKANPSLNTLLKIAKALDAHLVLK